MRQTGDSTLERRLGVERVERHDLIVLGSGVAGMAVALAAGHRRVLVASKTTLRSGSSPWAQGGIAAAVGPDDSPLQHAEDTLRVARGLAVPEVVDALTSAAPDAIARLIELGTRFDLDSHGELALGREGGHGRHRILHAGGDATGTEIVRAMSAELRRRPGLEVAERCFAVDLLLEDGRVVGVLVLEHDERGRGSRVARLAPTVVVATGGVGRLYAHTTNPPEVTGDGIAMAARAGARLVDLEFVQFHPTVLDLPPAVTSTTHATGLLTEALRGAGARLIDEEGRRILREVHPDAELAPRDLVARTLWHHRARGHRTLLDLRPLAPELASRFPTVLETCLEAGLDPRREPVPVSPAAHYFMGGIEVDADGRSSLPGLWACGEAASSGAHGANRLASNSLLEALVFGGRVARASEDDESPATGSEVELAGDLRRPRPASGADRGLEAGCLAEEIRDCAWRHLGLERDAEGLLRGLDELEAAAARLPEGGREVTSVAGGELRNLALLGRLIGHAALLREESRGSHYRSDHPRPRRSWARRLRLRLDPGAGEVAARLRAETPLPVAAGARSAAGVGA